MDSPIRARILVSGRVQGVAFRAFTRDAASRMKLCGGVRNVDDGRVEVDVEGERGAVEAFVELLGTGPPMARVDDLELRWERPTGQHKDFRIWY
jgi:acylphosphatase